jgi:hypothetical protein
MKFLSGLLVGTLFSLSCTPDFVEQNDSDVILRFVKIIGLEGEGEDEGDVLLSDVTPIFNDNARLSLEVIPKNPNPQILGNFNDVFLERYEVRYFRTDGRNTEGVDVPYRFTGAMATLVPANGQADAIIVVVRHTAKEEPPLRNLAFEPQSNVPGGPGGGHGIIHTIAEITVHGRTTSGKALAVTGRLTVTFADFADEAPSSATPGTSPPPVTPIVSPSPAASPAPK